jgi:hypothetical protein
MQQHKCIIPLLTESGYRPRGWLGLLLGSKMYFDMTNMQEALAGLRKELQRHNEKRQQDPQQQQQHRDQDHQMAQQPQEAGGAKSHSHAGASAQDHRAPSSHGQSQLQEMGHKNGNEEHALQSLAQMTAADVRKWMTEIGLEM